MEIPEYIECPVEIVTVDVKLDGDIVLAITVEIDKNKMGEVGTSEQWKYKILEFLKNELPNIKYEHNLN